MESRNFALNPKEGLKIHAFKGAHTPEGMADRELDKLARYMVHIATVDDFRILSHKVNRPLCPSCVCRCNCVYQDWKSTVKNLLR